MQVIEKDVYTKCIEEIDSSIKTKGYYSVYFNKQNDIKTECNPIISKDVIYEYIKKGATYTPYIKTVYFDGLNQHDSFVGFRIDGTHISQK